jgi:prepilin-type N-terminal cleavage/methylation domain-containing protein
MKRRGFTLIELIVVIALIGVVVTIALPRLDPFVPERRLKSAARLFSGTISLAYGEAIAKNKTYRLYIDTSMDEYWIAEVSKLNQDKQTGTAKGIRLGTRFELLQYTDGSENIQHIAPTEPMFAPRALPSGVHFSSVELSPDRSMTAAGLAYIEFSPLGDASPITINLVNEDGDQFLIQYDGVTGIPTLFPINSQTG